MNLERLARPFPANEVKWRVGSTNKDKTKGIALAYIDARSAYERLDDVCRHLWQCRYPTKGLCEIGLKIDGEWVWRANGAGETDFEGEKGQYSDSFKRAAVLWGIGRYLYNLPNEWVPIQPAGRSYKLVNNPTLPDWALPNYTPKMNRDKKRQYVEQIADGLHKCDELAVKQLYNELTKDEVLYIWPEFNSGQRSLIKDFIKEE